MAASLLVDLALKGTAVLLMAWGCASLLRRSSAAARHLVWAVAFAVLLAMPLLAVLGPVWRLEILPSTPGLKSRPATVLEGTSYAGRDFSPAVRRERESQFVMSAFRRTLTGQAEAGHYVQTEAGRYVPSLLVSVWATGALIGLLRLAVGLAWAAIIRRRAVAVRDPEWLAILADSSASLGLSRRVHLRASDRIGVPMTCGIVRPTLLLPDESSGWHDARRRAVVLHELAHVVRRDCLMQAIGHAARSLHWFNPLAFLALRRLREEQELACDDRVLRAGVPAVDYARHLCDVAGAMRSMRTPEWATLAMARSSNLEVRVVSILDEGVRRHSPHRVNRAAAAVIVVCVLPLSVLRLAAVSVPALPGLSGIALPSFHVPGVPDQRMTPPAVPAMNAIPPSRIAAIPPSPLLDVPVDELGSVPDFSGTWILDPARSASPSARQSDPLHAPQWGDVVVIKQADAWLRIESRRGEYKATTSYELDDRDYRYIEERRPAGGGVSVRGSDVKTVWDAGKLVTLTRPFSLWVPDEREMADAPNTSTMEFLNIRSLSADGLEMTVERVSRHDWGWGFDGRQPSAAYARLTDVYRRAP